MHKILKRITNSLKTLLSLDVLTQRLWMAIKNGADSSIFNIFIHWLHNRLPFYQGNYSKNSKLIREVFVDKKTPKKDRKFHNERFKNSSSIQEQLKLREPENIHSMWEKLIQVNNPSHSTPTIG